MSVLLLEAVVAWVVAALGGVDGLGYFLGNCREEKGEEEKRKGPCSDII